MPDITAIFNGNIGLVFKLSFIAFACLYFLFSLIIIRQVYLMTETIMTQTGPVLRAVSILHSGLALGIIILFVGFL
ncbi:hypothetical protein HYW46_06715 [Candidatus Daviesbacteria bacterium]|nr:hypothetical protein [Candidatus Daviesbacteria bacterium]